MKEEAATNLPPEPASAIESVANITALVLLIGGAVCALAGTAWLFFALLRLANTLSVSLPYTASWGISNNGVAGKL